jgi:hypothetical protein
MSIESLAILIVGKRIDFKIELGIPNQCGKIENSLM